MRGLVLACVLGATLAACDRAGVSTETAPVVAGAVFPDLFEGPADILTLTDAGYPMYAVTVRVEGYSEPIEMLLNDQGTELNGLQPDALAGQSVALVVITENRDNLMSMTWEGRELFASEGFEMPADAMSVTGVLEGAAEPTGGDLPDVLTINLPDGTFTELEAFITPEMAAANGQSVTARYVVRPTRSITQVAVISGAAAAP